MEVMRYLKIYEDFNNKEKELETMFSLVMGNTEVYKIPYSYYGEATKERRDFDIYVVSGTKQESDDYKIIQELYHNHKILNELLNLELFYINLTKYVTIVLYDYVSSFDKNNKNHLSSIYTSKLPIPSHIKSRLKFSKTTSRLSVRPDGDYLNKVIDWSDGRSSNIALFNHIYDPKEKVSESVSEDVRKDIEEICYDITDHGKFRVLILYNTRHSSRTGKEENRWVIFISLNDHMNYDGFLLSEVEDVLMRIKSYLGVRRYLGCEVVKVGDYQRSAMRYVTDEDRLSNITIYYTL